MSFLRPVFLPVLASVFLAGCAGETCPSCSGGGATVTPVAKLTKTATGQPLRLPSGEAQVCACTYDIPPGVKLPVHKHPYPRFAYVMAGDLRVVLADGRRFEYRTGDFIAEVVDEWHYGETLGSVPVRLLVVDTTPVGAGNVVPLSPAK